MSPQKFPRDLTPSPIERSVRSATVSIGTAVALILTVFGIALVPGTRVFPLLTAAAMALGAASVIAQLRHREQHRGHLGLYQWLAALGGVGILILGVIISIARFGASPSLSAAGMGASYYVMPIAALACFIGGLGQLPLRWVPSALTAIGGAAAAGWISLGPDRAATYIGVVVCAALAIVGCTYPVLRVASLRPSRIGSWLIALAAVVLIAVMLTLIILAVAPASTPVPFGSPSTVAWGYLVSALLAAAAGLSSSSRS